MKKLLSFFEIPAVDFHRAVKFYESVLGLKLSAFEWESEKMAFFPTEKDEVSGAISCAEGFNPSASGTLVHFRVNEVDATLALVEKNGGKIVRPKTRIECDEMGFFALISDSEGNTVGLHSDR